MKNFVYSQPTRIVFGRGTEDQVGDYVRPLARKVLLHYGKNNIKKSGLYDRIVRSLEKAGVEMVELSGVVPNPRLSLVREGIELCRKENVELVLAVGGGSVIDSAKAIAAGVPYPGDVWDFFLGRAQVKEALPVATVLTIPAAGSEASDGSVVTNEEGWFKKSFGSEKVRPVFSILDPELTFTLPAYQTAAGSTDIMAHVMERYFVNEKNVDLTDRLCEAVLKTIIRNLPIVLEKPDDYAARAEIMWAATLAHNDLLSTGRGGDWSSHQMEHELSGIYDIAHGAGLAIMFPAWMKYVYKHDLDRFVQFAVRVWDVAPDPADPEKVALEGIRRMEEFFLSAGMPVRLSMAGIDDKRIAEMADKCSDGDRIVTGTFVPLKKADIEKIYRLAL